MVTGETKTIRVSARLPNTQMCYEGTLEHASREGLVVNLNQGELPRGLRTGVSLLLTIQSTEATYELMTQLRNIQGTQLELQVISPPKRLDRRRTKRYPVNLQVCLLPPGQQDSSAREEWQVRAVNISRNGMRLIVPQKIAVGTVVEVCFALLNAEQPVRARAEVRYTKPLNDGQWAIGVRFVDLARTDAHWLVRLFP